MNAPPTSAPVLPARTECEPDTLERSARFSPREDGLRVQCQLLDDLAESVRELSTVR